MGMLQPWHLILVLVIVLIVFGPGKLPQIGKSLGDGIREFKNSTRDDTPESASTTAPAQTSSSTNGSSAQALSTAGQTCPSCGKQVSAEMRFCGNCGAALAAPAAAQTH